MSTILGKFFRPLNPSTDGNVNLIKHERSNTFSSGLRSSFIRFASVLEARFCSLRLSKTIVAHQTKQPNYSSSQL